MSDDIPNGQHMPSGQDSYELTLERVFDAAAATLYDTFLDMYTDQRPEWIVESHADLRVGGTWTLVFHPPGLEAFREVRVLSEVERPHRLAYDMTAFFDDEPSLRTTVEMTLTEQGEQTRISFVQSGFPTSDTRDQFADAWSDVFAELGRRVAEQPTR